MLLIAHRGNVCGPNPILENTPAYIQSAIDLGFDVEIDVRKGNGNLYLGHDSPDHWTSIDWLLERKSHLWVHAKNFAALDFLLNYDVKVFYHSSEDHVVIGNTELIWSHNIREANERSIIPLLAAAEITMDSVNLGVHGICSDHLDAVARIIVAKKA